MCQPQPHTNTLISIYLLSFKNDALFPCGSAGKESTCNAGDLGLIPGMGRSPGEGNGYPLQYSGLENSMDCIVHRVAKSRTRLSNFHFHLFLKHPYTNNKFTPQSKTMGLILFQCPLGC